MSAIIDAGENLMLDRQVSVAQTKTQGGRRLAQKRGPTLYNLEVDVPPQRQNGDRYYAIEEEMLALGYGEFDFRGAGISGKIGGTLTSTRNGWSTGRIASERPSGRVITIDNVDNPPSKFDYFQIPGSTKVYQVSLVLEGNTGSGLTRPWTITLNTPIVVPPNDNSNLVIGDNVSFNFMMMDQPMTSYQPGEIITYGTFKFQEVIKDLTGT